MRTEYIVAIVAGMFLLWWMFGRGQRTAAAPASSAPVPAVSSSIWLLVQGRDGPQAVVASRDDKEHGFRYGEMFYPDEFVRPIGQGGYFVATHFRMPSDGDLAHLGDWDELHEVPQLQAMAAWSDYNQARRRLNAAAVWQRGDGSSAKLRNLASLVTIVMVIWMAQSSWGLKGTVQRLADQNVTLSGQIARLTGPPAPGEVKRGDAPSKDGSLVPLVPTPAAESEAAGE